MGISRLLAGQHVRLTAHHGRRSAGLTRWYEDTAFPALFDAVRRIR